MSKRNGNGAHALKLDPHNARKHPDRNKAQIAASLKELGAGRSILVDATDTIIAGNGVYEQAQALGYKVKVIEADGKTLIAVKRPDLKGAKARRMALADNRATETSEWDTDILADLAANDADALAGLWDERELRDLLGDKMPGGKDETANAGELVDKAAELQAKWQVQRGDVWQVGKHRVMCGDSTNAADVARLMGGERARMVFTDPPWNVAIGKDSNPRHRQREGLQNDDMSADDFSAFLSAFIQQVIPNLDGDIYCVLGASEWGTLDLVMRSAGFHWSATIIWVKDIFVLGRSKYHRRYEPLWYGWHRDSKSSFGEARDLDDVWEIKRPRVSEEHPTMKPVELVVRAVNNSSANGDRVFDPFLGSGTTLVACEQTGRIGRGMEIEPKYVAVTLERLTALGLEAKRVTDTNGNAKAKRKTKAAA